jgi:hypothetical protein
MTVWGPAVASAWARSRRPEACTARATPTRPTLGSPRPMSTTPSATAEAAAAKPSPRQNGSICRSNETTSAATATPNPAPTTTRANRFRGRSPANHPAATARPTNPAPSDHVTNDALPSGSSSKAMPPAARTAASPTAQIPFVASPATPRAAPATHSASATRRGGSVVAGAVRAKIDATASPTAAHSAGWRPAHPSDVVCGEPLDIGRSSHNLDGGDWFASTAVPSGRAARSSTRSELPGNAHRSRMWAREGDVGHRTVAHPRRSPR